MFKNALISVSDKTNLIDFIQPLVQKGMRVVSTGGTAEYLRKAGISVVDLQEQTGYPEVMGGRVKTLHPRVHMPLLARSSELADFELLRKENLDPFDLVVVNLYPFESALSASNEKKFIDIQTSKELIEKIDIGGPTLLRAAAKNFDRVTVVVDPKDYQLTLSRTENQLEWRRVLAGKVFSHVARYDSLIADWLADSDRQEKTWGGVSHGELRYGENPKQNARWFAQSGDLKGLHSAEILQGKALSYNNILDIEAASLLVQNFTEPSAVAVKHNNPCGVASSSTLLSAVEGCLKADPVSVFGGIVALNQEVGEAEAELLTSIFLECVVAPSYSIKAKSIFKSKKNLRVLAWPEMMTYQRSEDCKAIAGGFLVQDQPSFSSDLNSWKYLGEKPSDLVLQDLIFAEKVCASLKSNSIAVVKNKKSLGLGMGQVNRVDAVMQALQRVQQHHGETKDLILASDAFFPFSDSVEIAAKYGVKWIIQPGGSIKDEEVAVAAKKMNVQMILTGERHFRH